MGEGAGAGGIFKLILALVVMAIVAFFLWETYLGAVAALNVIDNLLNWIADQIIFTGLLLLSIAVVYAVSMWARRNAPPPRTKTLAIRDQRFALARKDNIIRLPHLHSVPVQREKRVKEHVR